MEDALQLDLQEETAVNHLYKSILKLDPDVDQIDAKILARVTQRAQRFYHNQPNLSKRRQSMRTQHLSAQDLIQDMTMLRRIRKTNSLTSNQEWKNRSAATPLKQSDEKQDSSP